MRATLSQFAAEDRDPPGPTSPRRAQGSGPHARKKRPGPFAMKVCFNVWIEVEGEVALSGWRVALLEAVAATGSISAAAARQGVHFRVAWRKIREMEARLGERLVVGQAGGTGGGGASLTPAAEAFVRRFRALTAGLDEEVENRYRRQFPLTPLAQVEHASRAGGRKSAPRPRT